MKIAIIPARGGSKRIANKNVKLFCGKPIIAWSIESAIKSKCFDEIIVSTDDDEIASISTEYGALVPFKRPLNISDDHSTFRPVMAHALNWFKNKNIKLACCIYATAPFVQHADIILGLDKLKKSNCDYAISVTSFNYPIQRALRVGKEGNAVMRYPENLDIRSQDLETNYHDAGQFYWGTASAWANGVKIFTDKTLPVILPGYRVLDIDSLEDWYHAEMMFRAIRKKESIN